MVTMAIRADDLAGIGFGLVETFFLPAGDDLCRRNIVLFMAAGARGLRFFLAALEPACDDRLGWDIMSRAVASLT